MKNLINARNFYLPTLWNDFSTQSPDKKAEVLFCCCLSKRTAQYHHQEKITAQQ